jgi:hypothetical protein
LARRSGGSKFVWQSKVGEVVTATDDSHQELVEEMVRENQLKQQDVALKVGV